MNSSFKILPGTPHPLGATVDSRGVNFSVFSQNATSIELLLFEKAGSETPIEIIKLDKESNLTSHFWHVYVQGLVPGFFYAYRVDGPFQPEVGQIFNKNKVLIDPYSKGIDYSLWRREDAVGPGDNLKTSLRSAIIDTKKYNWEGDKPLGLPLEETIIYELHVGNFTKSKTSSCENRGTFSGLVEKIPYLKDLGITAVELMPVFDFDTGPEKNVWGYGSLGFFAPESTYCKSPGNASHANDFRNMVKALHRAGIEVILDVVFGFTNEKDETGPFLSFKGFDNSIYYMLGADGHKYVDLSGCGNTLNCNHPVVSKFILDCLEYWVCEMHVDGFRFDEASLLSRDENGNILQYPNVLWNIELSGKLANTKIFAEPWDAGGGYLVGKFPGYRFVEWNDKFRDDTRRFVKGDPGFSCKIISRLMGSPDLYKSRGRCPLNSLNFVASHDGFTLYDLVSYNSKHNEHNEENNTDGFDQNFSCNYGIEGPANDPGIQKIRLRQVKNMLTLLFLSKGIPMISMGDELGRTQNGNNNAYCQDNETVWLDWGLVHQNSALLGFTKALINFRRENDELYRENNIDISSMPSQANFDDAAKFASCLLGNKLFMMANMDESGRSFSIPAIADKKWYLVINTNDNGTGFFTTKQEKPLLELENFYVESRSIVVLVAK